MSFHGGFLGTILAMVLFARSRKIPIWSLIDVIAPSVTFGLFLGRLANFVNGELYGRVDRPAVGASSSRTAATCRAIRASSTRRCSRGSALFIVLRILTHHLHKLREPGFVSGAFAAGYGVARTTVEFFREPDIQIGYLSPAG